MTPYQRESATLLGHSKDVDVVASRVIDIAGKTLTRSMGLPEEPWLHRLKTALPLAARLHDIGKANSHFQEMIRKGSRQAVRHEALSAFYLLHPGILGPAFDTCCDRLGICTHTKYCILLAILNHHTKFNTGNGRQWAGQSSRVIENGEDVRLPFTDKYPGHDDFLAFVEWALGSSCPEIPFATLSVRSLHEKDPGFLNIGGKSSVIKGLYDFCEDVLSDVRHPECWTWRSFTRGLVGLLISCDAMGSALPFAYLEGGSHQEAMERWLEQQVAGVLSSEGCTSMLRSRLGDGYQLRGFQSEAGGTKTRITLITAGCGTGKTIAAYNWARKNSIGRKLFFTYPTTGTATEGFRDYMESVEGVESGLIHGRAVADVTDMLEYPEGEFKQDVLEGLSILSNESVSCTVDTVIGSFNLSGKVKIGTAALLQSAIVFDEAHAYDDKMFDTCIRLLKEYRGIPALFMTATLPPERVKRLRDEFGDEFGIIGGPREQFSNKKFCLEWRHDRGVLDVLDEITDEVSCGGRVLVVVNTVQTAIDTYKVIRSRIPDDNILLYHSRFRYKDRVVAHRNAIDTFKKSSGVLVATQVAEMSLDLDATLLVSEIAPVPALIQRFGRLNRRLNSKDVRKAIVTKAMVQLPSYTRSDLSLSEKWCHALESDIFSQQDMSNVYHEFHTPDTVHTPEDFDYLHVTYRGSREPGMPTVQLILLEDFETIFEGRNGRSRFKPGGRVEMIKSAITVPETKLLGGSPSWCYREDLGLWVEQNPSGIYDPVIGLDMKSLKQ